MNSAIGMFEQAASVIDQNTVSEPYALAIMGIGLIAIAFSRRRRRNLDKLKISRFEQSPP